jgi:NAD+ synthase
VTNHPHFGRQSLALDAAQECQAIVEQLKQVIHGTLHRQGAVVGISGGIDSSVVLALCARAFGPERVLGVLLPESESSDDSARLAHVLADQVGVSTVTENISAALQGFGCYVRRDEAIKRVIPEYEPGWGAKITLAGDLLQQAALNVFRVTVTSPDGREFSKRLPMAEFAQIVAASNFKQRARMSM